MQEVRQIGLDELDKLVEIASAAQPREFASVNAFADWRNQATEMVWLLAERDSAPVGAGYALTGWHTPPHRAIAAALVAAEQRGAGVGATLIEALERWAAEQGVTELEGPVAEEDAGSLAWTEARGYTEIGRNSRLVLHLSTIEPPEQRPPEGIEIVTWAERPELAHGMWDVARQATRDIPGEEEDDIGSPEEWLARDMQGASDDPRAVFVALAGDDVVGFAKLSLLPETPDRAYHDLTGVRREWRGRGIAGALKRTQIAWAKENGYATLQTANEVRNEPIRRLNERHGYVLEPGVVIVRRTIGGT